MAARPNLDPMGSSTSEWVTPGHRRTRKGTARIRHCCSGKYSALTSTTTMTSGLMLSPLTILSWADQTCGRRFGHWGYSFDAVTHDLWVGDVGQDRYEEVDLVRRGENYGWNVYEGFERFSNRYRREGDTFVPPVFAYTRKYGVSVTGGYVYRGNPKSSFYGVYICGDYESRRIFA